MNAVTTNAAPKLPLPPGVLLTTLTLLRRYAPSRRHEPRILENFSVCGENEVMQGKTRATLLERLRDGADQLSWEEFFCSYWPLIYAFARRRGCSAGTAEEVVQDVMLKVFENRDLYQYDPARGRFRDWLHAVVRNQVAERRRRPSERVRARGGDPQAGAAEPESNEPEPDAAWEATFETALLMVLLDTVRRETNPRSFLAFELSAIHGLPSAKVAQTTGLSRNAVYKCCKRVFKRLEELGAPYRNDGRLHERIKQALDSRPDPACERSLTARVQKSMRSR
jgi:RNA polymerase sigma factor (sigma-70 family)